MCVIYFVWYFNVFFYYIFSKILATNIDSITSYSKIREEIKFMYVCMYVSDPIARAQTFSSYKNHNTINIVVGITPQGTISFVSETWGVCLG